MTNNPIMNPLSLTEEQREAIKRLYNQVMYNKETCGDYHARYLKGAQDAITTLFGKDFFESAEIKKGEKQ